MTDDDTGVVTRIAAKTISWQVDNFSGSPVFDVEVHVAFRDHKLTPIRKKLATGKTRLDMVAESERSHVFFEQPFPVGPDQPFPEDEVLITLTFTDAAGLVWRRAGRRTPERLIGGFSRTGPSWVGWLMHPVVAVALGMTGIVVGVVALLV
ncbi:hypothetical protein [Actinoplanes sp. NPDC026623]|uniref:hypothetical protein n=1 Tax=Actinoplanes sp. NPDC026623 TaxID=3155610 RepID=UPI0033F26AFE